MAKIVLPSISSGYASTTQINTAFEQLEAELQDKVLYRDNPTGEPNYLLTDVDCNGKNLLNIGTINGVSADALTDLTSYVDSAASSALDSANFATDSQGFAAIATNAASNAAASAIAASNSAADAAAYSSVGFDVASTIYDFGSIIDAVLTFTTDYGSVV